MNPFQGMMSLTANHMKSPLESLFGKPRFPPEEIPPNMADLIGTLSKMAVQVGIAALKLTLSFL